MTKDDDRSNDHGRPALASSARAARTDRRRGDHRQILSITSYRRDGSGVSTPVWFAADGDRLLVMTDSRSGKVKRIRRNPYVTIAPCTGRGKPKAEPMPAHAELLPTAEVERAKRLIERKYRFDLLFVGSARSRHCSIPSDGTR